MDQRIIDLYDGFTHGRISRRDFFDRLTALAGSAAAATAAYETLRPNYARAAIVAENDPRLVQDKASFDTMQGDVHGNLVRLANKVKRPAVLVIHENRGLTPHIQDVARRMALEGFLVLAVDLLSTVGGTPADEDKARSMIGNLSLEDVQEQAAAAVSFLNKHPESTGKTGAIGFCWGGGMINRLAMTSPELAAGVAYYGPVPADKSRVKAITAPLLLHYAGLDTAVNPGIPAWEQALKDAGKRYTVYVYEGVNHAFNNDTGGPRYNKAAADLAWSRTVAFLKQNVGEPPAS
ncbi:carboxymethylenebutenolidase [Afipia sp. P52-10]|uniref:dienelactone hydrolase family protein n=1 Tax=Afipia sp. P52-10 TaxID=1429916 RepID=UPI0003DF2A9C|nr:dienelactone hydrolase family protein [Afipia sp. P52-10]ETR78508.1 carboxymethylenebutenolidase [Afipia sp. P52-10]